MVGYVLERPPAEERDGIENAIHRVLAEIERIAAGDLEVAMNALHRRSGAAEDQ